MPIVIGLDNGHGLKTATKRTPEFQDGTKSPYTGLNFMHEWEFNRRVVILLKEMLERCGFRVFEISPTDEDTPINDRWKKANDLHVNYLLSVHANALTGHWGEANGIETLVHKGGSDESYRIGRIIQKHMVAATGLRDRCVNMNNGLYERDDVGVLEHSNMPANLVECGFMDNLKEAKLLLSEEYRKTCAMALCLALCMAFNVTYVPEKQVVNPTPKPKITKFNDVPGGHWAEQAIFVVSKAGIMTGLSDTEFGLGQPVTREQLAAVVAKLLSKEVK